MTYAEAVETFGLYEADALIDADALPVDVTIQAAGCLTKERERDTQTPKSQRADTFFVHLDPEWFR